MQPGDAVRYSDGVPIDPPPAAPPLADSGRTREPDPAREPGGFSETPSSHHAGRGERLSRCGRVRRGGRATAGVALIGLLAGFGLAGYLTPSPAGLGTHQQLGLPPCTVRAIAGIPCPACGMTTSFSHFVRGQWLGSWSANPGGLLLALLCAALIPWLAWIVATGRFWTPGLRGRPSRPEAWGVAGLSAVGFVTLVDWFFRLAE